MINPSSSLSEILDHVWDMLVRGEADKKHPYHFPALATYGARGVQQRTVVLRKALKPARLLYSYSDARTQKIDDLRQHPEAHWLFYDHSSKEQIRAHSQVTLHHQDQPAREVWDTIPPDARGDYIGPVAPGTHTEHYADNLPPEFKEAPTKENTQAGFTNFVVMACEVKALDFLKLRHDGHLRARFYWQENQWKRYWAAP